MLLNVMEGSAKIQLHWNYKIVVYAQCQEKWEFFNEVLVILPQADLRVDLAYQRHLDRRLDKSYSSGEPSDNSVPIV